MDEKPSKPKGPFVSSQRRIEELERKIAEVQVRSVRFEEQVKILGSLLNDRDFAIAALSLANLQVVQCYNPTAVQNTIAAIRKKVEQFHEEAESKEIEDDADKV